MSQVCPICSNSDISSLDDSSDAPILMNKLYDSAEEGRSAKRGTLSFAGCRSCSFVWNAAFDPTLIVYDASYENDQTHSVAFARHLNERAQDAVAAVAENDFIDFLEIGCGQGRFIEEVALVAKTRLRSAEGFDPAWRGDEASGPSGGRIHICYFEKETASRMQHSPNVVVTRHTIEHVPDPVAFLRAIREALGPTSKVTIFIETPCVDWILTHGAMQDFFYEHCSLFTRKSLAGALHRAGFSGARVDHVFGGQYLWARASTNGDEKELEIINAQSLSKLESARQHYSEKWRNHVAEHKKIGPVALWGAGAKGVNFALIVDAEGEVIDHVIDINPTKQGKYLAGSGIPVVSPKVAAIRNPKTIYVMNPNYLEEIRVIADGAGIAAEFIAIN